MTKKLRIVHYPQVPCEGFILPVESLEEARLVEEILSNYDLFQFENGIKPDYSNTTVVEEYDELDGWVTWFDEKTGIDNLDEYFYWTAGDDDK